MSGTTPLQALPYPTGTDSPAGHTEIQNLAAALEPKLVMVFSSAAARTSAVTSPTEGMVSWLNDVNRLEIHDGTAWKRLVAVPGEITQRVSDTAWSLSAAAGTSVAVTWPIAFTATPAVVATPLQGSLVRVNCFINSKSTTGANIRIQQNENINVTASGTFDVIAVGPI